MPSKKVDLLFVANVPPPWTGQGVVHKLLLEGSYSRVRLLHIAMAFSATSASQGKVSLDKVLSLLRLILATYRQRLRGVRFLYFSPGGPVFAAVVRDSLYLLAVRPVMRSTMLVYHSSGVFDYIQKLPPLLRFVLLPGFRGVQLTVQLSLDAPPDGAAMQSMQTVIIPNAVPDQAGGELVRSHVGPLKILYMGVVAIGKGVEDLLLATHRLAASNVPFELTLAGVFVSQEEEQRLRQLASELPSSSARFVGPLTGTAKEEAFRSHDVFAFPSFWHAETFPLVLLEALSFSMPVVASRWRGIPELLGTDGSCGTLVDVHSIDQISSALGELARDPKLRQTKGHCARLRYESRFQVPLFFKAYDEAFNRLLDTADAKG